MKFVSLAKREIMRVLTDAWAAGKCFLAIVHKNELILMAGVGEEREGKKKGKNSTDIRSKKEKDKMGVRPWVTGLQPRKSPSQVVCSVLCTVRNHDSVWF